MLNEKAHLDATGRARAKSADRALQVLPIKLTKVGRTAIDGSWFNFYLCYFRGKVRLPGLNQPVFIPSREGYQNGAARCDLGGS